MASSIRSLISIESSITSRIRLQTCVTPRHFHYEQGITAFLGRHAGMNTFLTARKNLERVQLYEDILDQFYWKVEKTHVSCGRV